MATCAASRGRPNRSPQRGRQSGCRTGRSTGVRAYPRRLVAGEDWQEADVHFLKRRASDTLGRVGRATRRTRGEGCSGQGGFVGLPASGGRRSRRRSALLQLSERDCIHKIAKMKHNRPALPGDAETAVEWHSNSVRYSSGWRISAMHSLTAMV